MLDGGIRLYGAAWCSDCKRAKKFFGERGSATSSSMSEIGRRGAAHRRGDEQGQAHHPDHLLPGRLDPRGAVERRTGRETGTRDPAARAVLRSGDRWWRQPGLTAALYSTREGIETLVGDGAASVGRLVSRSGWTTSPASLKASAAPSLQIASLHSAGASGSSCCRRLRWWPSRWRASIGWSDSATGARSAPTRCWWRRLHVPSTGRAGEEDFIGAGVHFCATCDGPFYRDRPGAGDWRRQ